MLIEYTNARFKTYELRERPSETFVPSENIINKSHVLRKHSRYWVFIQLTIPSVHDFTLKR